MKRAGFVPDSKTGLHINAVVTAAGFDCESVPGFCPAEFPAVVVIKSIHEDGAFHAVAWDGKRIKDPNVIDQATIDYLRRYSVDTYFNFTPIDNG